MEEIELIKEMATTEYVYYSIDEMLEKFKKMIMEDEENVL